MAGLREALAWIVHGTSSSTIFSHSGYHHSLPTDGVSGSRPPATSGLTLQLTKPNSLTQRSSSSTHSFGPTPGDCGSWQTGEIFSGQSFAMRAIRSLHASVQYRLTRGDPKWCPIADFCG